MRKERINWTIEPEACNVLRRVAQETGRSQGALVSDAILKIYVDPLTRKIAERRQLVERVNQLSAEIHSLEELQSQLQQEQEQQQGAVKVWRG